MKVKFIIVVWGESYVENFNNRFLISFCNQYTYKAAEKFLNKESSLTIYTLKNDEKYFDKIKINKLQQHLNVEFKFIDTIFSKIKTNKYEFLSKLQNIIINLNHDSDYLSFVYPDFLFTENSIFNCLKLLSEKNYSAIFCPVPRIIEENSSNARNILDDGLSNHIKNNIHPFEKTSFTKSLRHNPSLITYVSNKYWIYKNFHAHPIFLRNLKNENYFSNFTPSIDEDFIKYYRNTEYYVAKNSNEMLFASMTKLNEMRDVKTKFDNYTFAEWSSEHIREIHKDIFIKFNYIMHFSNDYSKDELKEDLERFEKFCKRNFFYIYIDKDLLFKYYREFYKILTRKTKDKSRDFNSLQKLAINYRNSKNQDKNENKYRLIKDII